MRLIDIVEIQSRLIAIGKEEKIEGVYERIRQAVNNYSIVFGKSFEDPNSFELKMDALEYGINQATIYLQQRIIERGVADEEDDYHLHTDDMIFARRIPVIGDSIVEKIEVTNGND